MSWLRRLPVRASQGGSVAAAIAACIGLISSSTIRAHGNDTATTGSLGVEAGLGFSADPTGVSPQIAFPVWLHRRFSLAPVGQGNIANGHGFGAHSTAATRCWCRSRKPAGWQDWDRSSRQERESPASSMMVREEEALAVRAAWSPMLVSDWTTGSVMGCPWYRSCARTTCRKNSQAKTSSIPGTSSVCATRSTERCAHPLQRSAPLLRRVSLHRWTRGSKHSACTYLIGRDRLPTANSFRVTLPFRLTSSPKLLPFISSTGRRRVAERRAGDGREAGTLPPHSLEIRSVD